jgi:uncharacterized oxidoreductase
MPIYCASKAGMHAFSMAIRVQLADLGMKVFEIVPPMVDTAIRQAAPSAATIKPGWAPRSSSPL